MTDEDDAAERVTVSVTVFAPLLPSLIETSATETVGSAAGRVTVTVCVPVVTLPAASIAV